MANTDEIYQKIIQILDELKIEYKLFNHKAALSYSYLLEAQKETGFLGTEGKCMVLKVDENFVVYVTLKGKRLNFDQIKNALHVSKVNLASQKHLKEYFGAEPGCAYPFGFDSIYDIYVDPEIYQQEWFLFSPIFPNKTVQAKGSDLKKVFANLENKVTEVYNFNS